MKGLLFIILFYITYLSLLISGSEFAMWLKPFLVPSLLLLFLESPKKVLDRTLIGAIGFSAIGDLLLIFDGRSFFILGLLSFLLAHLFYIWIFKKRSNAITLNIKNSFLGVIMLVYYVALMSYLWPHLGEMRIPVMVYGLVISSMLWMAAMLVTKPWGWLLVMGAVLFVVSDSLLSVRLFVNAFDYDAFWVMLTYLSAQLCLVYGLFSAEDERS